MGNLEIQYPGWYVLLCLVVGAAFALLLYYRSGGFPDTRRWVKTMLGFTRFLAVSLLSLLLLSPVLRNSRDEVRKPIIVFAQDQSLSIRSETDSMDLASYEASLINTMDDLGRDYEVRSFAFGEEIRESIDFAFTDRSSNQSSILEYIGDLYGDQNLGAVVYATDGIFNEGIDPLYSDLGFTAPVYAIAMGDTTPDKDLLIRQIFHNNIAYLGDKTAIQVDVSCYNGSGQRSTLGLYRVDGDQLQLIEERTIDIDDFDYFQTLELNVPQEQPGLQRYRVVLSGLAQEKTLANNRKDFFIDVIDARQRILMLYASPHPDVAALKAALEENKNYEVEAALVADFEGTVQDYDLVVLHQLPDNKNQGRQFLQEISARSIPYLMVVGNQTQVRLFNSYQDLVQITLKGRDANLVQADLQNGFALYTLSDPLKQIVSEFPPIDAPFAEFDVNPAARILMQQRIGKVETDFPLWLIGEEGDFKQALILAEGLWRWKLYDYLQNDNNTLFNELIGKTVQYLTLKEDKRKFRVFQVKNLLAENEDVLFDAELYNQSYELINEPDVNITIYDSGGDAFNFTFTRKNNGYSLDAGKLPVGDYSWSANTQYEGERYTAEGQFSVQAIEKELYATVANHNVLRQLASQTNGTVLYPSEINGLAQLIQQDEQLKPIYYQVFQTRNAIHLKWIFFILLALLVMEWALRRYYGTY